MPAARRTVNPDASVSLRKKRIKKEPPQETLKFNAKIKV